MGKLGQFAAACAAVLCAFGVEAATTFVWSGGGTPNADGTLNWSDAANWKVGDAVASAAPVEGSDIAQFEEATVAKVRIDAPVSIATLYLDAPAIDITFTGGRANVLFATNLKMGGKEPWDAMGAKVTIDGASLSCNCDLPIANGMTVTLRNGACFKVGYCLRLRYDNRDGYQAVVNVESGSLLQYSTCHLAGEGTIAIHDATVYSGAIQMDYGPDKNKAAVDADLTKLGGGRIVFKGRNPVLYMTAQIYAKVNPDPSKYTYVGGNLDFEIPSGGYGAPPIQGASSRFWSSDNNSTGGGGHINILPTSPALATSSPNAYQLVYWNSGKGFATDHLTFGCSEGPAVTALTRNDAGTADADYTSAKSLWVRLGDGDTVQKYPSATPISPYVSAKPEHYSVGLTARIPVKGTDAATPVSLWIGETDDPEALVKVETSDITSSTAIGDTLTVLHRTADLNPRYCQLRQETVDAAGQVTSSYRTLVVKVEPVDKATYTWRAVDGCWDGDWSDARHWSNDRGGDCLPYPQHLSSTASFPAIGRPIRVTLSKPETCANLKLANVAEVTLTSADTNDVLTCNSGPSFGEQATLTLDHAAIRRLSGDQSTGPYGRMILVNGSDFYCQNLCMTDDRSRFEAHDSNVNAAQVRLGRYATLLIDNSYLRSRSGFFSYTSPGGDLVLAGRAPRFVIAKSNGFNDSIDGANLSVRFIVPEEGWTAAPVRAEAGSTSVFMNDTKKGLLHVYVSPDSPVLATDFTGEVPLVTWQSKGIKEAKVSLSDDLAVPAAKEGALGYVREGGTATGIVYAVTGPRTAGSVTVRAGAGGSVTGGGSYAPGEEVTLRATPDAGKAFFRWIGDTAGFDPLSAEVKFTAGSPIEVKALFGDVLTVAPSGAAYTTIEAAYSAAKDYDTIRVADGNYVRSSTGLYAIDKPVCIESANGPSAVRIKGNGSGTTCRRGYIVRHELAVVQGLTFYDMYENSSSTVPALLDLRKGTVRDCVFTASTAYVVSPIKVTDGLLSDCVVAGVTNGIGVYMGYSVNAAYSPTATGIAWMRGGRISNCVFRDNCAPRTAGVLVDGEGAVLENSFFAGNMAAMADGYDVRVNAGTVSGCTFVADGSGLLAASDALEASSGAVLSGNAFANASQVDPTLLGRPAAEGFAVRAVADRTLALAPAKVNFSAAVTGGTASGYSWSIDGVAVAATAAFEHEFAETGRHTVTVTATGDEGTVESSVEVCVTASKAYASETGGNVYPFDSVEKAATNVQDAVQAVWAEDGCGEVEVCEGRLMPPKDGMKSDTRCFWIKVFKNVWLHGDQSDPGKADIFANSRVQTMMVGHPKARIEAVTLRGGKNGTGGAMTIGNLSLNSGTVTNCFVRDGFGAYYGNCGVYEGVLTHCVVTGGNLNQSGVDRPSGGVNLVGAGLVDHCTVTNNTGGYGCGVYVNHANAVLRNSLVAGNKGGAKGGGGVCILAGLVENCTITDNTSNRGGGGVGILGGEIRNCIIARNKANGTVNGGQDTGGGGGVYQTGGTVANCTIYGNGASAPTAGHGIYATGGQAINTIVSGNGAGVDQIYVAGGRLVACCVPTEDAGYLESGVAGDPGLASPSAGDFTLMFGAATVDAGRTMPAYTNDIAGMVRPVGAGYDMGAYEMDFADVFTASFESDVYDGHDSVRATLTAKVGGGVEPYTYLWTVDGVAQPPQDSPVLEYEFGFGSHTVALQVTDGSVPARRTEIVERKDLVRVRTSVAYVSNEGTAEWPYDTWAKATPVIQDAVDAVYSDSQMNGTVYVADGTYVRRSAEDVFVVSVAVPVTLLGTNADCKAVVDGEWGVSGKSAIKGVNVSNARAFVANLAVTRTHTPTGTGNAPAVTVGAGVCSNMFVHSNSGDGLGGIRMDGGVFTDSMITNANGGTHQGSDRHGAAAYLYGGTLRRTRITKSTGGFEAVMVNGTDAVVRECVIENGSGGGLGGVAVMNGLCENCIVRNNTITDGQDKKGDGCNIYPLGSGIAATTANATVRNCLIVSNTTVSAYAIGAGLYATGGAKAYNCTSVGNRYQTSAKVEDATKSYQAACDADGVVANTIAAELRNDGGVDSHNLVGGDPKFRSPKKAAFHLKSSSPCVNAGDNSFWDGVADPKDLDGTPRIRNGIVDIGCFEGDQSGLMLIVR